MAKKVKIILKLNLPAGAATPAPPVGTALGPHGVPLMDFVNAYNKETADKRGQIIPVEITIYQDTSFEFVTKTPPASSLLMKAAGVAKGSDAVLNTKAGSITKEQLKQIAEEKMEDINAKDIDAAMKIIAGTAQSMGIEIKD
ncbi:50S ribosomal protein L11 [bacterium]|uniref:Large ribosomal subunit protein uL11 n=2 Tax=Katanobacteria TaxID=422282 RepID=A0A2M7X404_UNCKA|nr:50S ribosomal protein L11 [bacterium]PIP56989.1 MAG: 50S ribosomal protein L11 [candidate division WWE3 bacterium CG22_combo_CG10-13_8_21_14_all_39_12]PJA40877.1 MAG: 50S ribosomal protein L11 [candidate division WWE3 bacterium CG_4_9_14_3_um_filter_39_7]